MTGGFSVVMKGSSGFSTQKLWAQEGHWIIFCGVVM
jgi:hypothetical protein